MDEEDQRALRPDLTDATAKAETRRAKREKQFIGEQRAWEIGAVF